MRYVDGMREPREIPVLAFPAARDSGMSGACSMPAPAQDAAGARAAERISPEFEALIAAIPYPAWICDESAKCLATNIPLRSNLADRLTQCFDWRDFIVEKDCGTAAVSWDLSKGTGRPFRARLRLKHSRKQTRCSDLLGCRLRYSDEGELWLFQAVPVIEPSANETGGTPDVSHIQTTLNSVPADAWYASADGMLLWVNARTAAFLGLPETHPLRLGEGAGNDWRLLLAFVHPADRRRALHDWGEFLSNNIAHETKVRLRSLDQTYRWFLLRAEPLYDPKSKARLWLGINIDIEEELRADEALRALKERLARATQIARVAAMSASIAHEINQPLGAIVANAHAASTWLSAATPNVLRTRLSIDRILRDGRVAADVVRKMRNLFSQQPLQKCSVSVARMVSDVLTVLDPEICKQEVEVTIDIPDGLDPLIADPVQIQQILINLITNAIDAVSESPSTRRRIAIEADSDGDAVAVRVRDTGCGVPNVDRIFEAFFTTRTKGMGIGLAVSRSIAEAHDGSLSVVNQPGSGAEFTLRIPCAGGDVYSENELPASSASSSTNTALKGRTYARSSGPHIPVTPVRVTAPDSIRAARAAS
jgi:signal transduction histidine kinase